MKYLGKIQDKKDLIHGEYADGHYIRKFDTMPTASADYVGEIVQYTGATTATYLNGGFYRCTEDSSVSPSTYSWVRKSSKIIKVDELPETPEIGAYYATPNESKSVTQMMFDIIHPVNSFYQQLSADDNPNTIFNVAGAVESTWQDVSETYAGRYMKVDATNSAGTQIAAGLPNITGAISGDYLLPNAGSGSYTATSALKTTKTGNLGASGGGGNSWSVELDASRNNAIYGNSTTVTPLTITTKLWKRVS